MRSPHESPDVADLLRASDALLQQDRYRDSLRCVLQAFALAEREPELLLPLCQRLHRFNETGRALALIARTDPDRVPSVAGCTELASLASRCGDQSLAEAWIEHALRVDPTNAPAQYLRGVVAMFRGDFPQARFALSACLAIAPDFAQAHWVLSTLPGDSGGGSDAPARIRTSLARTRLASVAEAYLQFALHNELHRLERYEDAWKALERGCALRRAQLPHDVRASEALFAAIESRCTQDFLQPLQGPKGDYTPIFIVGMHRSGTTLLERILAGHPQVSGGGESRAFTSQLDFATDHKSAGAIDAITLERVAGADFPAIGSGFLEASRWRARAKPFLTEKLPANLLNAGLIAKALPHAKLIRVVRNPMDTCFSNLRTFFSAAAAYSHDQVQLADHFLRCEWLARHFQRAMPGRMLDVAYDDLVRDTEAEARRVFDFCGLSFAPVSLDVGRASGDVATASTTSVRAGILRDRGGAWKPYARQLQPMREALETR